MENQPIGVGATPSTPAPTIQTPEQVAEQIASLDAPMPAPSSPMAEPSPLFPPAIESVPQSVPSLGSETPASVPAMGALPPTEPEIMSESASAVESAPISAEPTLPSSPAPEFSSVPEPNLVIGSEPAPVVQPESEALPPLPPLPKVEAPAPPPPTVPDHVTGEMALELEMQTESPMQANPFGAPASELPQITNEQGEPQPAEPTLLSGPAPQPMLDRPQPTPQLNAYINPPLNTSEMPASTPPSGQVAPENMQATFTIQGSKAPAGTAPQTVSADNLLPKKSGGWAKFKEFLTKKR